MADQTVRIQKDDVAATAYMMAMRLWDVKKFGDMVADDPRFYQVVLVCTEALSGKTSVLGIASELKVIFGQKS